MSPSGQSRNEGRGLERHAEANLRRPVLTGPHNFNGEEIAQLLMDAGAAFIVADTQQLAPAVTGLLDDANLRGVMGAAGRAVLDSKRGALDRLLTLVEPLLE